MNDESWHDKATATVRILQIIVFALVAGVVTFLGIALNIGPIIKPPAQPFPSVLTMIALAFVGVGLIARAVVLSVIVAKARRQIANDSSTPAEHLLSVYQNRTIVSGALFEGWTFFATIAYMIEGNPIALGLAVLLILCLAAHFPTRSRVVGWVERQLETVEQEKMRR